MLRAFTLCGGPVLTCHFRVGAETRAVKTVRPPLAEQEAGSVARLLAGDFGGLRVGVLELGSQETSVNIWR